MMILNIGDSDLNADWLKQLPAGKKDREIGEQVIRDLIAEEKKRKKADATGDKPAA